MRFPLPVLWARLLIEAALNVKEKSSGRDLICMALLDIEKAYPSVSRNALWRILANEGVPPHMVKLITHLHSDTEYKCKNQMGTSEPYMLKKGIREGCPSAVWLSVLQSASLLA